MAKEISKATYDSAVTNIRRLLSDWFNSGVELFLELKKVDDAGVWKHPGHATFGDFLRAEFPTALGIERYQNVINAINVYGVERVKQVGIESCHALTVKALVEDDAKRTKVLQGIDQFVKKNGCAPDRNKVRELVQSVAPETRKLPKEITSIESEAVLREQLRVAKARIRELESEVKRLSKENERLSKGALAKTRGEQKKGRAAAHA